MRSIVTQAKAWYEPCCIIDEREMQTTNNKCPKANGRCNLETALTVRLVAASIAKQCSANKKTDASCIAV